jgi:2-polyprenyl-3-methyl-5-hydroxy-6-metoxy-1,4-benzoquinol methylase
MSTAISTSTLGTKTEAPTYSDGESEVQLLNLFSAEDEAIAERVEDILSNKPTWPLRYHLSPERHNLLSWYSFQPGSSLLEVGAGCGALTGLFCERLPHVTAIELTSIRAQIIAKRHKNYKNLDVIPGNIHELNIQRKFDFVSCIGVLEYAGRFTRTNEPYKDFLNQILQYLSPAGTLILALENKFGLKYWAGAKEDHTSRLFESIENYSNTPDIRTFAKSELMKLLNSVGLNSLEFYYPLPDYKLPMEIFSDNYLPTARHNVRSSIVPTPDYAQARTHIFDERLALDSLITSQAFDFFANSFLVFARRA